MNEKVNAKDLKASERSPVIPDITNAEKAKVSQDLNDKAKKKAEHKAERLEKEKAQAEKAKEPKRSDNKLEEALGHKAKEKEKKPEKVEQPLFPAESKVNKYGFIYMSGDALEAFGLKKGVEAKLIINLEDDRLVITKA
jgi:ATPase subunit of ABC transporter with duplicated ATPase domains